MTNAKKIIAGLGLCSALALGIAAVGAAPAKADSLGITDYNGHVGFGLSLGTPNYYGPGYAYGPDYYAPGFYGPSPYYAGPPHGGWVYGGNQNHHRAFHRNWNGHNRH